MPQDVRSLNPQFRGISNLDVREQSLHIILVDAHQLTRQALQHVVTTFGHMHILASLSTIDGVLAVTNTLAEQVAVLSPSIPISDCLTLAKQLRERRIRCGVVAIQQDLYPETARLLIEQGVRGLLDEQASEQDLLRAIRTVAHGNLFLSQRISVLLSASIPQAVSHLTRREIQVVSHLKCGASNFRIARALGLKEKTVEKYLTSIYDKLNVCSRAEAILCLHKMHF